MKIKILVLSVLLCLLCGCAYKEPNDRYTVTALGFSAQEEEVTVHLQAIDASGGEQNGSPVTFLVTGRGRDIDNALDDIRAQLSKEPSFGHCQLVLFSEGIEGERLEKALLICDGLGISLRARMAFCGNIEPMLDNGIITDGSDLVALIKQNSRSFGYGAHTALFEIKTAELAGSGEFALPVLSIGNGKLYVDGLCRYRDKKISDFLSVEDSVRYAKEKDIYEGE